MVSNFNGDMCVLCKHFSKKLIVSNLCKNCAKKILAITNVRSHQGLLNGTNLKKFGQFETLFWYFRISL